jgi:electron transfer flavoprotein alpha subunit
MSPERVSTPPAGGDPAPGAVLVVLEPEADQPAPGADVLRLEAARVAGALGAGLRFVIWPAGSPAALELVADALAGLVRDSRPALVVLPHTDAGRQLAPMVAHRAGSGAVVGCSDVVVQERRAGDSGDGRRRVLSLVKPLFGGWLQQDIDPADGAAPVVTLDLTGMQAPGPASGEEPAPEVLEVDAGDDPVRRLELVPPDARSVDLVDAQRIVAVGSGAAGDRLRDAVGELADQLDGSLGATRPVTDEGRLPKERLIGQTGRSVTPELYLALGISGSPHHLAGVRSADRILSVNRDVRAPIFQFSDVGYVADLEGVLPALVARIKAWRDEPGSAR